jgi:hypothetical protein
MPIQFAEVTIIQEETLFRSFWHTVGFESNITENDMIILTFDGDDYPWNTKTEYETKTREKKISFSEPKGNRYPLWFETDKVTSKINRPQTEWLKRCKTNEEGKEVLNVDLFKNHHKFKKDCMMPSSYNAIYYSMSSNEKETFGIVRIKSTETKPRFMVAYEDTRFDKSDVIYLVHCLFTGTYDT